jgi:hypothetical protein
MSVVMMWNRLVNSKYRYLVMFSSVTLAMIILSLFGAVSSWWVKIGFSVFLGALAALYTLLLDKRPELRFQRHGK